MTDTLFDPVTLAVPDVLANNGGRVRASDPQTSKDAARTVKAGTQRARVLLALADCVLGLNGWEASIACDISRVHAATTRMEELEALGFAHRDGSTRPTDTNCQALVFFATAEGVEASHLLRSRG